MDKQQIEIEAASIAASLLSLQALLRQTEDPDVKLMIANQLDEIEIHVEQLEEQRRELDRRLIISTLFNDFNPRMAPKIE
jgi:hypothetical protein